MAKYKVIKNYSDKHEHKTRHIGHIVELTEARAKELKDFVEKIKDEKPKKEEE